MFHLTSVDNRRSSPVPAGTRSRSSLDTPGHLVHWPRSLAEDRNLPTPAQTRVWCALLAISTLLFVRLYGTFQLGTYSDDAAYVVLSESLARSDRYGLINQPGQPGETQFPFGYPLVLSAFVLLFPANLPAMTVLSLGATLINSSLIFWGWRLLSRQKSHWWAVAVVGMYLLSPLTVDHTRMVMSEPLFTTYCLAALLLAGLPASARQKWYWSTAVSLVLLMAMFTRTIGVALVASVFLYIFLIDRIKAWRTSGLIIVQMGTFLLILFSFTSLQASNLGFSGYLASHSASLITAPFTPLQSGMAGEPSKDPAASGPALGTSAGQVINKFVNDTLVPAVSMLWWHLGRDLRDAVLPGVNGSKLETLALRVGVPRLPFFLGFLSTFVVLLGLLRWMKHQGLPASVVFLALYSGILFFWGWEGSRLLYPIQMQLHFAFLLGIEWVFLALLSIALPGRPQDGILRLALVATAVLLLATSAYKSIRLEDSRLHVGDLESRSSWVKQNTAASSVVMSEIPTIDYVYGNRKTVSFPHYMLTPGELDEYLDSQQVDFIILAPSVRWQADYEPNLSVSAARILSAARTLASEDRLVLEHASEQDQVFVFARKSTQRDRQLLSEVRPR